jgi:hypothetical protein
MFMRDNTEEERQNTEEEQQQELAQQELRQRLHAELLRMRYVPDESVKQNPDLDKVRKELNKQFKREVASSGVSAFAGPLKPSVVVNKWYQPKLINSTPDKTTWVHQHKTDSNFNFNESCKTEKDGYSFEIPKYQLDGMSLVIPNRRGGGEIALYFDKDGVLSHPPGKITLQELEALDFTQTKANEEWLKGEIAKARARDIERLAALETMEMVLNQEIVSGRDIILKVTQKAISANLEMPHNGSLQDVPKFESKTLEPELNGDFELKSLTTIKPINGEAVMKNGEEFVQHQEPTNQKELNKKPEIQKSKKENSESNNKIVAEILESCRGEIAQLKAMDYSFGKIASLFPEDFRKNNNLILIYTINKEKAAETKPTTQEYDQIVATLQQKVNESWHKTAQAQAEKIQEKLKSQDVGQSELSNGSLPNNSFGQTKGKSVT